MNQMINTLCGTKLKIYFQITCVFVTCNTNLFFIFFYHLLTFEYQRITKYESDIISENRYKEVFQGYLRI